MKYLDSITFIQFKNYPQITFDFKQKCIAILGRNGSGKTNLLDGIYYLCFTKSYFNKKEKNNIQYTKDGFKITGIFIEKKEKIKIDCLFRENKKTILRDDIAYEKLSEHIGFQTAVIIAPDDISIINGYSEDRRKFFDGILSQMDALYLEHLMEYQKVLVQKNSLLKNSLQPSKDLLQIYNKQLIQHGTYIIEKRQLFAKEFHPVFVEYYSTISDFQEQIEANYTPLVQVENWETEQIKLLESEIQQRRTIIGPHTDDWDFLINRMPIKTNGSQGQKKSFLLALKLSQIKLLNIQNKTPILLLDDIFEKLDKIRLHAFFKTIKEMQVSQIFLTHTDITLIDDIVKNHFENIDIIELKK